MIDPEFIGTEILILNGSLQTFDSNSYPSIPRVLTHSNEKQHYLAIKNFLSQSSCQCWMFERANLKEWHSGQMI